MVKGDGTLYSNRENFRAQKVLVAAKYSGKTVDLQEDFDIHSKEFLCKFPVGSVPGLEFQAPDGSTRCLSQSHAIAYYVSNDDLKGGSSDLSRAQVLQWMCFADYELLPAVFNHVFPILELLPKPTSELAAKNEHELFRLLGVVNSHLVSATYLVDENVTLADICVCCNLLMLFERGLLKEDRVQFPHLMRWFDTIINQKKVKEVIGEVKLCQKLMPLSKEEVAISTLKQGLLQPSEYFETPLGCFNRFKFACILQFTMASVKNDSYSLFLLLQQWLKK